MNTLIDFLSGNVPGGFLLLLLILFVINLSLFFFYRGSKLFTEKEYKSKSIKSTVFILVFYITLWFLLRDIPLPDSVLFLPFQKDNQSEFVVCELLEQQVDNRISEDYRLHYWGWFYDTCIKDSINNFEYRLDVAKKLDIGLIVTGQFLAQNKVNVEAKSREKSLTKQFEFTDYIQLSTKVLSWLNANYNILSQLDLKEMKYNLDYYKEYTKAKLTFLNSKYKKSLKEINNLEPEPPILKSEILLQFGIEELKNSKKTVFEKKQNKYFAQIVNLLIPLAKAGEGNASLNRILGRMYLYEEKYKESEIFLKKALTQNPYDSKIYYDLYFLHNERFEDLGFENRFEVLKKAIELNKGYADAVFTLANDYFQSGTGIKSGSGTTLAIEAINQFMNINNQNRKILNLLASINLQIKHTEQAISIYKQLIELGFTEGEIYYNLGIAYFHQKDYKKAEEYFFKSIKIDDYPDSYLYIGAINKIIGNYDKALYYYRERIKRSKKGEDDYYAKEALHGLQWILKKQYEDSVNQN